MKVPWEMNVKLNGFPHLALLGSFPSFAHQPSEANFLTSRLITMTNKSSFIYLALMKENKSSFKTQDWHYVLLPSRFLLLHKPTK